MSPIDLLPSKPGTYLLHLSCDQPGNVEVGRLGPIHIEPGTYLYCGSAHGPGGLRARLGHHLQLASNPHWHLDYLRHHCRIERIWYSTAPEADECLWAATLARVRGCKVPSHGFGASDCRCSSHLLWRPRPPTVRTFRQKLSDAVKRHGQIKTLPIS